MKLLLYCTKAKPYLFNQNIYEFYDSEYITSAHKFHEKQDYLLNGKIVAECDFEVERIFEENRANNFFYTKSLDNHKLEEKSCLNLTQLKEYLFKNIMLDKNEKGLEMFYTGYAIHIKNLHIFDKPKELSEYYKIDSTITLREAINRTKPVYIPINKASQNMMYCFEDDSNHLQQNILISIKPEWLCKILNGEKTIEVRKKVLKEML